MFMCFVNLSWLINLDLFWKRSFLIVLLKISMKFCTNFGHFSLMVANEMTARSILFSKGPIFRLIQPTTHFEWKCLHFSIIRQYSTESSERLPSSTESYGFNQNCIVINNMDQNILSNFGHLADEQFQFHFFPRFQTPAKNFDYGLFKFKFILEIVQFQYWSYLIG
jgi:hypothetical protein